MVSPIDITREDLRSALWRGVRLADVEKAMLHKLKGPLPGETAASPLYLLRRLNPDLASFVSRWLEGTCDEMVSRTAHIKDLAFIPYPSRGINVKAYLAPIIKKLKPQAIAVDASPAAAGAALHYGFSLLSALKIPARVGLCANDACYEENFFQPGDFLPELAAHCFRTKLPLVPLAARTRLIPSQYQKTYDELLYSADRVFSEQARAGGSEQALGKKAAGIMNSVFSTGLDLNLERETVINEACYAVSRLLDLCRFGGFEKTKQGAVLVLYALPHALDLPALARTFLDKKAIYSEIYKFPEPQEQGSLRMAALDACGMTGGEHDLPDLPREMEKALDELLQKRMHEELSPEEVDRLASAIAAATRRHPLIARAGGVRGTLATREIAQGYGLLRGRVTRRTLAEAAFVALCHRNHVSPGEDVSIEEILKSIISRTLYNIPLFPEAQEHAPGPSRPLTPEEIARALMGLTDAAVRQLGPGEGLPLDNPGFGEEAMNHPLVQQALKDAMEKGLLNNMQQSYQDLLKELEDRGYLDMAGSADMTISADGQKHLKKSLEEMLATGEITPEDLARYLNNAKGMPKPPGAKGEKISIPPKALGEMLAELMDFQHQGRSQTSSLEDLYVHYTLSEKKGLEVSKQKIDYEKLKILIHDLEKKGMVALGEGGKRFTLSSLALGKLLEKLVKRQQSQSLERRAFKQEMEIDKSDVRRFRTGDVFRHISMRHSLRRIMRKGKAIDEINRSDLRSFEKKPSQRLDVAICVDVSASMKDHAKLRYAKMAIAELAKAALAKQDRVGIVSFSNLGQVVVPLTDRMQPILEATMTMKAEQYTNIGNGLICARRILLKEKNSNPKYIVLITDGQPNAALIEEQDARRDARRVVSYSRELSMERKELIGTQHALTEAGKTSRKDIKISVIFISQGEGQGEQLAREIARIGHGRFHKVLAVERLPLEALATVA
jgi:Mg-chelatase subunit ChlD